jgi:pyruvate formate lyase activating enzyme
VSDAWERRATSLQIADLVAMSTDDWPGHVVATAYLQGCPWRCTYCHGGPMLDPTAPGVVPWSHVTDLLRRRRGLLDGLVLSGGEPTRQPGVVAAAREVKDAGFLVGLHTAGAYPGRLPELLPHVDRVVLDVKAPAYLYRAVTRTGAGVTTADKAFASLRLVLDSGVDLRVRTTVDPAVLTDDDVAELTAVLADLGVRDHVLQDARPGAVVDPYADVLARVPRAQLHRG